MSDPTMSENAVNGWPSDRLSPGDDGFEQAVIDGVFAAVSEPGRPELVVRPHSVDDVAAAVRAAAAEGKRIAIRSGGHSWVAASVREGGVLLDLGHLADVSVAEDGLTARIGPAIRGRQLSVLLEDQGLAFPVGHCGDPGVGGFLLGGGLGVNWGQWLPSCFSVRSMQVVTADGEVRTASADENADLFWLARGSGAGFPGVVTEFEVGLRPLPGAIRVSTWQFPLHDLAAVTEWIEAASSELPSSVEVSLVTQGAQRPGGPGDEPFVVGVAATVFADSDEEAAEALRPLGDGPADVRQLNHVERVPARLSELHVPVDATYPRGARYLADPFWTDLPLSEAMAPLDELMRSAPSGRSYVLAGMPDNGAGASLVPVGEAAYGMHDVSLLIVYVIWDDPVDDQANRDWLDEVAAALLPTATGHALSEADIREHPERVARSFRAEDWDRIRSLTETFDPAGLFYRFPTA